MRVLKYQLESQGKTIKKLEKALKAHLAENPMAAITRMDDTPIEEGTPIEELIIPGGVQELPVHPDAE